jgi:hypothetical protein
MICDLNTNIKDYNKKILNKFSILPFKCPKCTVKYRLIRHCYYERNVCYFSDDFNICDTKITILRVFCKSCLSTHAILPGNIIPYKIYDERFITRILSEYYIFNKSVLSISEEYSISYQQIYKVIKCFMFFLKSLYFVLRVVLGFIGDISDISGILSIINQDPQNFCFQFFINTKWVFLMTKFKNIIPRPIYVHVHFKPPT